MVEGESGAGIVAVLRARIASAGRDVSIVDAPVAHALIARPAVPAPNTRVPIGQNFPVEDAADKAPTVMLKQLGLKVRISSYLPSSLSLSLSLALSLPPSLPPSLSPSLYIYMSYVS